MKFKITRVDVGAAQVAVTFSEGEFVHRRMVNACFDGDGKYDPAATKLRVIDVARGVEQKMAVGAIGEPATEAE
jgi:hypothetical protein